MPCLDPCSWSIVRVSANYIQAEECVSFIDAAEGATPRNRSGVDHTMILKNRLRMGNLESAGIELATEGADGLEEPLFRNLSGKKDRGVRSCEA